MTDTQYNNYLSKKKNSQTIILNIYKESIILSKVGIKAAI